MPRRAAGPSTLSRLFAYARTPDSDPRENFTTEALAGAIRSDPQPMLAALARHGIIDPDAVDTCDPYTQAFHPGAGTIDLMLQLSVGGEAREVWVEVKVDAPESGVQLDNYQAFIDAGDLPRELIVLAKDSLAGRESMTTLRWREVASLASTLAPDSRPWSDLVTYLEEIGMTEHSTYPISLREAASLEDAWGLFQKAASAILAVNRRLPELDFPEWMHSVQAGRTGWVTTKLHEQFVTRGRVMFYGKGNLRGKVFYGFVPRTGKPTQRSGSKSIQSAPKSASWCGTSRASRWMTRGSSHSTTAGSWSSRRRGLSPSRRNSRWSIGSWSDTRNSEPPVSSISFRPWVSRRPVRSRMRAPPLRPADADLCGTVRPMSTIQPVTFYVPSSAAHTVMP